MMLLWASHFACKEQQRVWCHCKTNYTSDASYYYVLNFIRCYLQKNDATEKSFTSLIRNYGQKFWLPAESTAATITEATTGSRLEVTAPVSVYASASAASSPIPKQTKTSDIPPPKKKLHLIKKSSSEFWNVFRFFELKYQMILHFQFFSCLETFYSTS